MNEQHKYGTQMLITTLSRPIVGTCPKLVTKLPQRRNRRRIDETHEQYGTTGQRTCHSLIANREASHPHFAMRIATTLGTMNRNHSLDPPPRLKFIMASVP